MSRGASIKQAANDQACEPEPDELSARTRARATDRPVAVEQITPPTRDGDLSIDPELFLETLRVLVTRMEQLDENPGGHSMRVARVCEELATRIRLSPSESQAILMAAYLHDVGIPARAHVTAFDAAQDDAKVETVRHVCMVPGRLLQPVPLPEDAFQTLRLRFERVDGKGFPDGLTGTDIGLGARMLAVAESYVDLTQNEANVLGRRLAAEDACDAISKYAGSVFDPEVVGWLRHAVVDGDAGRIARMSTPLADPPLRAAGARGVSGSLREMSLADVIQVLANGRKSGRLEVSRGTRHGEMRFHEGAIHEAHLGDLRGADAVYALLRFTDGSFSLVPDDVPVDDVIGIPTHHLLLEAMRRLDEEQR